MAFHHHDLAFVSTFVFGIIGIVYPFSFIVILITTAIPLGLYLLVSTKKSQIKHLDSLQDNNKLPREADVQVNEKTNDSSNHQIQGQIASLNNSSHNIHSPVQSSSSINSEQKSFVDLWGLPTLCVKDMSETPVPIESEYFKGIILIMIRTEGELEQYNRYASHFEKRQRKFEIQLQGQFKKLPQGTLMMGGEIPKKMTLGLITRTLVKFILRFCITLIKNLRYSFGDDATEDGKYETAYISFPLYRAMDRAVETAPNEEIPKLGMELPESNENRNRRRSGKTPEIVFKLGYTYSFSFHSMYLDFANWKICSIPGYKAISIQKFIGADPFHIIVYEVVGESREDSDTPHYVCNRNYLSILEFSHISNMTSLQISSPATTSSISHPCNGLSSSSLQGISDVNVALSNGDDEGRDRTLDQTEDEELTAADQDQYQDACDGDISRSIQEGSNSYVRTHTNVPLFVLPAPWESEQPHEDATEEETTTQQSDYLISVGLAPSPSLQLGEDTAAPMSSSCDDSAVDDRRVLGLGESRLTGAAVKGYFSKVPYVRFIKVRSCGDSYKVTATITGNDDFDKNDDDVIRQGDVVMLRGPTSKKFLQLHRGWWLRWSDEKISSKNYFFVCIDDNVDSSKGISGTILTKTTPFYLRPVNSSQYEVGCYTNRSYKHGGAPLAIFFSRGRLAQPAKWLGGTRLDPLRFYIGTPESTVTSQHPLYKDSSPTIYLSMSKESLSIDKDHYGTQIPSCNSLTDSEIASLTVNVTGWLEMTHRKTKLPIKVFLLVVSVEKASEAHRQRWLSIRSSEDMATALMFLREHLSSMEKSSDNWFEDVFDLDSGDLPSESMKSAMIPLEYRNVSSASGFARHDDEPSHVAVPELSVKRLAKVISNLMENTRKTYDVDTRSCIPHESDEPTSALEVEGEVGRTPDQLVRRVMLSALGLRQARDGWFLSGNVRGMVPLMPGKTPAKLVTLTARAQWTSHWREEVLQIFPSHIAFTRPYMKKLVLVIPMEDILNISALDDSDHTGIITPCMFIIRIETLGRVYYLGFKDATIKDSVMASIVEERSSTRPVTPGIVTGETTNGFTMRSGHWLPSYRTILNSRLFALDMKILRRNLEGENEVDAAMNTGGSNRSGDCYWKYSERLLRAICSLDASCCDEPRNGQPDGRGRLLEFLNDVSALYVVDLKAFEMSSVEALCFFLNVYHTLVMHARLLLGAPNAKSWNFFFSSMCYEIGGEVFSLAEIEQCVLRGFLSRARNPPPQWPQQISSSDSHFAYTSTASDQRINFIINYGSVSHPPLIYLVTPDTYYSQLKACTQVFLSHSIRIDSAHNLVTLPKVFEIFQADFGDDVKSLLGHCLRYLRQQQWEELSKLLSKDDIKIALKFRNFKFEFHPRLQLIDC